MQAIADEAGFLLSSESRTGALLRTLAAAKPAAASWRSAPG
jgi:hypothetical protein